jgi:HEPN domain-containing protein
MSREKDYREWLRFAESDRQAARALLTAGFYEQSAFYCQQAIEKLLKAIIVKQTGDRPPHLHDLLTLLRRTKDVAHTEEIERWLGRIDNYYVGTRYPLEVVENDAFKRPLAEAAIEATDKIFVWFSTHFNFDSI